MVTPGRTATADHRGRLRLASRTQVVGSGEEKVTLQTNHKIFFIF